MSRSLMPSLSVAWRSAVRIIGGLTAAQFAIGAAFALDSSRPAVTEDSSGLETVVVSAQKVDKDSAAYEAPSSAPLYATEPTSLIDQHWIENNVAATGNYDDVVSLAPSVFSVSPNGPGLMENQVLSIRGFIDGQFNVTFDGIPFQDANDFTHHTTSYFIAHDIGSISVDRGPGTALNIGNATFGGSISVRSKDPSDTSSITPYVSFGSFGTGVIGAQVDTGALDKSQSTTGLIDVGLENSNGYLENLGLQRRNVFTKWDSPINDMTTLTFVAMFNQVRQYVSLGATAAEIAANPRTGLSTDPSQQNYYGYNKDNIHTDFEYAGIKSNLGNGWLVGNKLYTYAYYHDGFNGEDPNGTLPNGTGAGPTGNTDVPGEVLLNNYRSWGDTFNVIRSFEVGDLHLGAWYDRQTNARSLLEVDYTLGMAPNTGAPNCPGMVCSPYDRLLQQVLTTAQGFVQFDWKATAELTVSPGVRYTHFARAVDATVNVKTGVAQSYTDTFNSALPSIVAHYAITPQWAAYVQAAKGALAPNENFFNHANPSQNAFNPQQTWNYQAGTSWQSNAFALSGDVYYIDFSNLILPSAQFPGTYVNEGGATYKGVEFEASVNLGAGLSVFGNGSLNSAKDKASGMWLPTAPDATLAAGLAYDVNGVYASLREKWIGKQYGDSSQSVPIDSYSTLDASLGYTFPGKDASPGPSVKLEMSNLLDSHKIYALAGTTYDGNTNLYWTIPGRSFFVSVAWPLYPGSRQ